MTVKVSKRGLRILRDKVRCMQLHITFESAEVDFPKHVDLSELLIKKS